MIVPGHADMDEVDAAAALRLAKGENQNGIGVAGVYTYEVAEMKVRTVETLARQREFPLMLSIEPEE